MEIFFVLVDPASPANIGAAARAIKIMGFSDLRLVRPCSMDGEEKYLAHGAGDVLSRTKKYESLALATADADFVVGTTARKRRFARTLIESREIRGAIQKRCNTGHKIAIVFGCEASGLSNNDLELCQIVSSIPLRQAYPSCNLSQAVMIYAYELSAGVRLQTENQPKTLVRENNPQRLSQELKHFLPRTGIFKNSTLFKRIMDRTGLLISSDRELIYNLKNHLDKLLKDSPGQ